ncbi:NAD(+) synthase [Ignavibacteria bacterium]|nr:NAD(+) synthase [Bacteroidota bacterium]MCZ2132410.1 NAD(+) synthase [Bacteroidota bacterium]
MNLSLFDLFRVGTASPALRVADVEYNTDEILAMMRRAAERECRFVVFPELCITGYTCGDLFHQTALLRAAERGLERIAAATEMLDCTAIVGLPIAIGGRLFNCAATVSSGQIAGIVPKTFIPNYAEYQEARWFSSARDAINKDIEICGCTTPFGTDILFRVEQQPYIIIGTEICEDLWSVVPPSCNQATEGAIILANISASNETVGKADYRRRLVRSQSERCLAAYLYAAAGPGESTTDLVFGGHSIITENGMLLAEAERFDFGGKLLIADIDAGRLLAERRRNASFGLSKRPESAFRIVKISQKQTEAERLLRPVHHAPFVPDAPDERDTRCQEVFAMQTTALAKRMRHTGLRSAIIGVSGGIDSTLALLATIRTFDKLGLPHNGVTAVVMPGFGTTKRTRSNAGRLSELLGCSLRVISIEAAVRQHFLDLGHDENIHDILFENAQARERTQILMDAAHQSNGLVIGTGDLSEIALGWCTYNGDHISMYGINAGIPKTLARYMVEWAADKEFSGEIPIVLRDIIATPVSPELLPPAADGNIEQFTEKAIGPYHLHDFFLYYAVRFGMPPAKIMIYAEEAFRGKYERGEISHWLKIFYRRFFTQQFKRSCMPDGVKVGGVSLSPRGDWRMPSDAEYAVWLDEIS